MVRFLNSSVAQLGQIVMCVCFQDNMLLFALRMTVWQALLLSRVFGFGHVDSTPLIAFIPQEAAGQSCRKNYMGAVLTVDRIYPERRHWI